MYFGDYLVQKNVINYSQLLEALCFQIESMPSMIRIVIDHKVIDSKEMLELLKKQAKDDQDILTVLKNEKKLTDEKINELELKQLSYKIPLGEAIVKLNFSSMDTVDKLLKEFYDQKFNISESEKKPAPVESTQVEISAAALESLKELGITIDEPATNVTISNQEAKPFVDQYLDLFSEKFKKKLLKLTEILEKEINTDSDISNYLNSLYRDLHLLKGAIALSELLSQEKLITAWENKIEIYLSKSNDEIRIWCKQNIENLNRSINLLWDARTSIEINKTDLIIDMDEKYASDLEEIIDKMS